MKLPLLLILAMFSTAWANSGRFYSAIVESTDAPLTVEVRKGTCLKVVNFMQEGGSSETRGLLVAYVSDGSSASAASATIVGQEIETQNPLAIAGPAKIVVTASSGAKLFLTYRLEGND